jgi:hypothetical protein
MVGIGVPPSARESDEKRGKEGKEKKHWEGHF